MLIHSGMKTFSCGHCKKVFLHRRSLIRHIENEHVKKSNQSNDGASSSASGGADNNLRGNEGDVDKRLCLSCVHCTPHANFPSVELLKNHLNLYHGGLLSFECGKCQRVFLHKTSMIRHIEKHIKNNGDDGSSADEQLSANDGRDSDDADNNDGDTGNNYDNGGANQDGQDIPNQAPPSPPPPPNLDLKEEVAMFLLKLRSSGNMTNTSIQMIIDNLSILLKNVMLKAQEDTRTFLNSSEIPPEDAQNFLKSAAFNSSNIFDGLETFERQLDFYCKKFGLVIPEELYLGSRIENRFDRHWRMFLPKQVSETFQYVSLIDTLTLIVRNAYFRNLILSETQSEDGVYRSYKDGSDFANNRFLRKYPHALRIVLYYDGLEIANALGSKDVVHQLGCFYISIQNLPPEESSLLSSIFLLALCYAIDLKKPGAYKKVLAKFVSELKQLQSDEGIEIDLPNGEKFILRACLVTLTADTLAAHEILGFFTSSGADKFCRVCMISKRDFEEDTTAIGIRRTSFVHDLQVREVEQRPATASCYGLRERSPLSEVMRVPEDSVLDVFHDCVGVIQMFIKLALYEFIMVRKLFSVKVFNDNIDAFVYGKPESKNKPTGNFSRKKLYSAGHTLRQYGCQTFCLLRVFPFLITRVEENNKHLQLIFLLQDIMRIIFSFELRETDIIRLEGLLNQLGRQFHEIYILPDPDPVQARNNNEDAEEEEEDDEDDEDGEDDEEDGEEEQEEEENVNPDDPGTKKKKEWKSKKLKKGINKLHHIMHYPEQIREKGPIIRLWCARYEGRHRILRKHSAVQCNFKNPPKTMARMFQLSTLSAFLARNSPHADDVNLSGSVSISVQHSPYCALLTEKGFQEDDFIKVVESANVCGEDYQSGLFVMLKQDEAIQPVFAVILDVVADTSDPMQVFLIVNKCRNTVLSTKYNAYKISNQFDETHVLVNVKNLANHRPIAPWSPLVKSPANIELYLYPRSVPV
ncbi:hypothetical protein FOCC_FOCC011669 [Frankliniella occidentalis]|nr:hypothetical protein FOCC_FOCC011669 [Frankliniella occidentalis]